MRGAPIDSKERCSVLVPCSLLLPTTPAYMRARAELQRGYDGARGGGVLMGPIAPTSYIVNRSEKVGPGRNPAPSKNPPPRNPAGATCNFPFFNHLETEFEKVVFTKL